MKISSAAFKDGEMMPKKYTADGENISPPLAIEGVPLKTESLILIMEDPDAQGGTFTHWLVWNISPEKTEIKEGGKTGFEGRNDFGRLGYGGPCPPSGIHKYVFRLHAMDGFMPITSGSKIDALKKAMTGHILEQATLIGRYSREYNLAKQ